jgi:hypothetical protein
MTTVFKMTKRYLLMPDWWLMLTEVRRWHLRGHFGMRGYPVTKGCLIILGLFLYAEDFAYGKCLKAHVEEHGQRCETFGNNTHGNKPAKENDMEGYNNDNKNWVARPAMTMIFWQSMLHFLRPGGFVMYNQTVELASMLNRGVAYQPPHIM